MIRSGAISVFIGMLPAMKTTEPYSPIARANASAKPVSSAGESVGRITRRNVCSALAPSVAAASSISGVELLEHRLHGAHDERQADEDERDQTMPIGSEGDLDAERRQQACRSSRSARRAR